MKKQAAVIAIAGVLALSGLAGCSGEENTDSQVVGTSQEAGVELSQSADNSDLRRSVILNYHKHPTIEYSSPINVAGDVVLGNINDDKVQFTFDGAALDEQEAEGITTGQVLQAMSYHILVWERVNFKGIGILEKVNVDSQSDMSLAGTQMTKFIGTVEDDDGHSRPFVGYSAITDGYASWFYVSDASRDGTIETDVLEGWADKIAPTYRVVS